MFVNWGDQRVSVHHLSITHIDISFPTPNLKWISVTNTLSTFTTSGRFGCKPNKSNTVQISTNIQKTYTTKFTKNSCEIHFLSIFSFKNPQFATYAFRENSSRNRLSSSYKWEINFRLFAFQSDPSVPGGLFSRQIQK